MGRGRGGGVGGGGGRGGGKGGGGGGGHTLTVGVLEKNREDQMRGIVYKRYCRLFWNNLSFDML